MKYVLVLYVLHSIWMPSCTSIEIDKEIEVDSAIELWMNPGATIKVQLPTFQIPDEKFISTAVKNIAHYLRNFKFNEWDQRYHKAKPLNSKIGFYDAFPSPTLKTLHWKVYENCHSNFYKCIAYLHSVIELVPFGRNDDIVTLLYKRAINNVTIIKKLNDRCKELYLNSERSSVPFDSPLEKFQWRTTASYYMCWYTMQGTPVLSMIGDACDNFASCLDPLLRHRHHDPRSDDKLPFACALYSFCPDPCCPLKHVHLLSHCYMNKRNPCFQEDYHHNNECQFNRKNNNNLKDIIRNNWNASCTCKKSGFIWKSQFGMCVDINECFSEQQMCDRISEDCLNTPGSFKCICKWGFEYDRKQQKCVRNDILGHKIIDDKLSKIHFYKNMCLKIINIFW